MRNGFVSGVACALARPPPAAVVSARAPAPSMKPRLDDDDRDGLVWSQQKHPLSVGIRIFVIASLPDLVLVVPGRRAASNPEVRTSPMRSCASEVRPSDAPE